MILKIHIYENIWSIYINSPYFLLGATLKEKKQAAPIKADITYQTKWGEVLTSIEYKVLNIIGEIIRLIDSNTLKAPNNWPIWDGATKFVSNDFNVGVDIVPIEAIIAASIWI